MTPEEAKALLAQKARLGRPASQSPEERKKRKRAQVLAAHRATSVLARLYPDEYEVLRRTALSEELAKRGLTE